MKLKNLQKNIAAVAVTFIAIHAVAGETPLESVPANSILTLRVNKVISAGSTSIELFNIRKVTPLSNSDSGTGNNESTFVCLLPLNATPRDYTFVGDLKLNLGNVEVKRDFGHIKTESKSYGNTDYTETTIDSARSRYTIALNQITLNGTPIHSVGYFVCEGMQNKHGNTSYAIDLFYSIGSYYGGSDRVASHFLRMDSATELERYHLSITVNDLRQVVQRLGGALLVPTEQLP